MPPHGNRCVAAQPSSTPFVSIAYLRALARIEERRRRHRLGAALPHSRAGGRIAAACPLYLKDHSYGEYVFDWAWADAYRRHGLDYYPKLVDAVPFTPVPGPRLLARVARGARAAPARHRAARPIGQAVIGAPSLPRRRRPGGGARGRLVDAQHRPVPLDQPRAAALRRFRRIPLVPATREAKEDPAGAPPRRRGRRHVHVGERRRHRQGRLGLLLPLLHPDLPRPPLDALPDARFLRPHRGDDGRQLAALHRLARRQAHRGVADRDRPGHRPRSAATGAPSSTSAACTSRPATTSRWRGASSTATGASRAAPRASTRWRAG